MQYRNVTDGRTDGRTDRQTDRIAVAVSRVSLAVLLRDKKSNIKVLGKLKEGTCNNGFLEELTVLCCGRLYEWPSL